MWNLYELKNQFSLKIFSGELWLMKYLTHWKIILNSINFSLLSNLNFPLEYIFLDTSLSKSLKPMFSVKAEKVQNLDENSGFEEIKETVQVRRPKVKLSDRKNKNFTMSFNWGSDASFAHLNRLSKLFKLYI